jgi:hypothetical protein
VVVTITRCVAYEGVDSCAFVRKALYKSECIPRSIGFEVGRYEGKGMGALIRRMEGGNVKVVTVGDCREASESSST